MLMGDVLSRIFVCSSTVNGGLDHNWPMIYKNNLGKELPTSTSTKTQNTVIQNLYHFFNKNDVTL